ncbi:MAG TPA: thioesterase family protein [Thermoanaerobaculia bacterium]|nr:thioesterase family protein [Thermoanaerobaculia bacterium]
MSARVFSVAFEVRFPEVDSYGVVWHGHYVAYFEVARNALCAAFGLTPADALAYGYKVPITRVSMDLKRPARLDDRIVVTARLAPPETAKLVMDYEIRREATGELLASGTTEQVFLDPSGQLLLTFPAPVKTLVARVLAFQRGEAEPDATKILPVR